MFRNVICFQCDLLSYNDISELNVLNVYFTNPMKCDIVVTSKGKNVVYNGIFLRYSSNFQNGQFYYNHLEVYFSDYLHPVSNFNVNSGYFLSNSTTF